jgi:hypothetical protein
MNASAPKETSGQRPWWQVLGLSASAVAILISVVVYLFTMGKEIGSMQRQIDHDGLRLEALEQRGSGPVQRTAERLDNIVERVDRMLDELLKQQKQMADLVAAQARETGDLGRMKQDVDELKGHRRGQ